MNKDLTEILKVGDKVYSYLHGWLIVSCITRENTYCIEAKTDVLDVDYHTFSCDGRTNTSDINPVLFPSDTERDWSKYKKIVDISKFVPLLGSIIVNKDRTIYRVLTIITDFEEHLPYGFDNSYTLLNQNNIHLIELFEEYKQYRNIK